MATDFSSKQLTETYSEGVTAEELTLRPVVLDIVGDVKEKTILDIGCGDGRYSIVFANSGAKVVALDLSPHQIEIAKQKHSHPNIHYGTGDVSTANIANRLYDLVFANMVVPDLDGVGKLEALFSLAALVLNRDRGRFIFSSLHPLYLSPSQDEYDRAIDFNPADYFGEGKSYRAEALTNKGNKMLFNETHFSLTFVSKTLKESGLSICSMTESKQIPEKEMLLPKYLIFECGLS